MRRVAQLVAFAVTLLLASQSAVADEPCSMWLHSGDRHLPSCCVPTGDDAATHLLTDCHRSMRSQSIASECIQSGCQMASARTAAQAIVAKSSGAGKATRLVFISLLPVAPDSNSITGPVESASSPGPAKYLLFQVFRI